MRDEDVKLAIETAFAGVTLSGGTSLRQADVIDHNGEGCTEEEFRLLPLKEITDSWRSVPIADIEDNGDLCHMDALGFRYYIAAYMHSSVVSPSWGSIREISTIMSLCPSEKFVHFSQLKYTALSFEQRRAILLFLEWFRSKPDTEASDREVIDAAITRYWSQHSETPNQSTDPTLASGTPAAGQPARHP